MDTYRCATAFLLLLVWTTLAWAGAAPQRLICVVAEKDCHNLVVVNADGSQPRKITPHEAQSGKRNEIRDLACAPDGSRIAYCFVATMGSNIFLADVKAGGSKPLTKDSGFTSYLFPSWSRDSKSVAFLKGSMFDQQGWVIDANSGAEKQLTKTDDTKAFLKWSPDGQRFAYISKARVKLPGGATTFDQGEIMVLPATGGEPVNVSKNTGNDCFFAWSADGRQLAFVSQPVKEKKENMTILGSAEIWTVPATGGPAKRLTVKPDSYDEEPAWSPDGKRIAFTSVRDGGSESIYVMNADGSNSKCLTDTAWGKEQRSARWSPDGSKIAYAQKKEWVFTVFVMNPDGSEQKEVLTDVKAFAWIPAP